MRDSSSSRRLFSKAWARNRDRSRAGTRLTNLVANSSGKENVIFLAAIMPYYHNHFGMGIASTRLRRTRDWPKQRQQRHNGYASTLVRSAEEAAKPREAMTA